MLEDHIKSPTTRRRLRAGPAAPYIDTFADWLHENGYKPSTINTSLLSLAAWTDWLTKRSFSDDDFVEGYNSCAEEVRRGDRTRYQRGPNANSISAAALFIRFLRERGVLAHPEEPPSPGKRWPILAEFRAWTIDHRGVTHSTMDVYEGVVKDLIAGLGPAATSYTAESIRGFVAGRAQGHGLWRAKGICTAVRAFLRFLAATGRSPEILLHAVPRYANWQLASTPRYLEPEDVERTIDACSDDTALGTRDRAVVLLLARLGLRASDVAGLTFADIDWPNGRIGVLGHLQGRSSAAQVHDESIPDLLGERQPLPPSPCRWRVSAQSCATALLAQQRTTPRSTSICCRGSLSRGRRCRHAERARRALRHNETSPWFPVA